jgi:hypothetical protein
MAIVDLQRLAICRRRPRRGRVQNGDVEQTNRSGLAVNVDAAPPRQLLIVVRQNRILCTSPS